MGKIKILFRLDYLYHKAAIDPLLEEFRDDQRFELALEIGREPKKMLGLFTVSRRDSLLHLLDRDEIRLAEKCERFDVVVVGDTIKDAEKYGRTLLCLVNHGTGIKNVIYRRLKADRATKYMLFVEGDYRIDILHKTGALGNNEVYKIGLPKIDPYFNNSFSREKILRGYGLNPDLKTVLFAPTYKPTCIQYVKDHIFTETAGYNLIIKLHHYSWMGHYASHRHHRIFEKRVPKFDHAVLIPANDYNILPLMSVADTLISEASSTIFDFLALEKFGIIYNLDYDRLKHSDGEHILSLDNREFLRDAFMHINSPDEIGAAIRQALHPTKKMEQAAAEYRQYFFHELDGKASSRFKKVVEQLLLEGNHLNEPHANGTVRR